MSKLLKEEISHEGVAQPNIAPSESAPVRVMSTEDSLIADLVKEQPTPEQIAQIKVTRQRQPNLLELPEECLSLQNKQYQYAWLTKGKDLSVKLRTNGWILCNRTNSPYIKPYRFGTHGALEQSGMLLAFMPQAVYEEMSMIPVRQSQDRIKHYTKGIFENQDKDAPITFYKPEPDEKD
jgi:hypothetical protein